MINAVIGILLFFSGAVNDHISRRNGLFHTVYVKRSPSRGHVEDLIVYPAFGPMGGKFGCIDQMIGAAAGHKKGMGFEIDRLELIVPISRVGIHEQSSLFTWF
jgi:hypothetical protein